MIISIGTKSKPKIIAIMKAFANYPDIWVEGEKVTYLTISDKKRGKEKGDVIDKLSGISCIPNGIEEIVIGAKNRAKNAFEYAQEVERHL